MGLETPAAFLLLLPPAPSPQSLTSLRAAYGETLIQVLKEVASQSSDYGKAAVLEIALACPHLVGQRDAVRSSVYSATQTLVAGIYKLVCVLAAQEKIDVEDVDGVDVRLLLVAWSPDLHGGKEAQKPPFGPIIDLSTLALCQRRWQYAFGVEGEQGEAMVKAFVAAKGSGEEVMRVQSGHVMSSSNSTTNATSTSSISGRDSGQKHHHVAVGGTFDHLHIGHKSLLTMTAFAVDNDADKSMARTMTIGITGDELLKNKKHAEVLESWDERQAAVQSFLGSLLNFSHHSAESTTQNEPGPNGHSVDLVYANGLTIKCTEIADPFGPTVTDEAISALIISGETRSGGKAVNDKRKEKGWSELEVFEVDVLDPEEDGGGADAKKSESFASKISSSAIREKIAEKQASGTCS